MTSYRAGRKQRQSRKGPSRATAASCGCGVRRGARKALAVDPRLKTANLHRLRRVEGQVRGLQRMVAEERYCADILMQAASVEEALRSVCRELMRNHLRHCATEAIRKGSKAQAEAMYSELIALMDRHSP